MNSGNKVDIEGECCIIIPAFNAENLLPALIDGIRNLTELQIIVVDDGSVTPVSNHLDNSLVKIHRIDYNSGKGNALQIGFKIASAMDFSFAVTMDADLQHPVKYIPDFVKVDSDIDLVCGKRDFKQSMPFHRRLSNFLTSTILSWLCGVNIPDSQCGFRRYKLETISNLEFQETGFMFESEVLIRISKKKDVRMLSIPIDTVYNEGGSHIKNLQDTLQFIKLIIRHIF